MPLTEQERKAAVERFFKEANGRVDAETLEKTRQLLDPAKPESEPLLTALTTVISNGWEGHAAVTKAQQEAAEAKRIASQVQADYNSRAEALTQYKEHLENNFVPAAQFEAAQQQIKLMEEQQQLAVAQLNELGIELEQQRSGVPMTTNNNNPNNPNSNPPNPNPPTRPENPLEKRYITIDQFQPTMEQFAGGMLEESARLTEMKFEHKQLTGKDLDTVALAREARAAGKVPSQFWEEKFKIQDLRQEAAVKQREAEIEFRANEIAARKLSEQRLAGTAANSQAFQNAAPYTYRAAMTDRQAVERPRLADFQQSVREATESAIREFDSVTGTRKFTDGQTYDEARISAGL